MRKSLLVTGSSGLLGSNFIHEVGDRYDITGIYRSQSNPDLKDQIKADLTDADSIRNIISVVKPDALLHCAAIIDVERCEQDYELVHKNNALVVKNLISFLGPAARFIYISTDSIFDGRLGNYSENDTPSPLNNYAKAKLEGEGFVTELSQNFVIIRTNLFGWNRVKGESLAEWVLNNLSSNKPIKMFTDVLFSPITVNTLSLFIDKLLNNNFCGTLNIASKGFISKYEFGVRLASTFGLDTALISPMSVDAFSFKAKRPKNTTLNVGKAESIFGPMPIIKDEIERFYDKRIKIDFDICKEIRNEYKDRQS